MVRWTVELEPVPDAPALVMKGDKKWVCVADLHIGIEVQLRRAGFNIPSQTPKILAGIESLLAFADRLLILGDFKHRIPGPSYKEDREIPPMLRKLLERYHEIMIVAGNHDGGLANILPSEIKAVSGPGTLIEDVGVMHGHVWPSEDAMRGRKLLMGHIHPSVLLTDSLGTRTNVKCWLRAGLRRKRILERYDACPAELVVVPSFSPLLTGTPVNSSSESKMGPLFKNELVDRKSVDVYLLDGTNLGLPAKVKMRAWPEDEAE